MGRKCVGFLRREGWDVREWNSLGLWWCGGWCGIGNKGACTLAAPPVGVAGAHGCLENWRCCMVRETGKGVGGVGRGVERSMD